MNSFSRKFRSVLILSTFGLMSQISSLQAITKADMLGNFNKAVTQCHAEIKSVAAKDHLWHIDQKKCTLHPIQCVALKKLQQNYTVTAYNDDLFHAHTFAVGREETIRSMIKHHPEEISAAEANKINEEINPYVQNCKNAANGIKLKLQNIEAITQKMK